MRSGVLRISNDLRKNAASRCWRALFPEASGIVSLKSDGEQTPHSGVLGNWKKKRKEKKKTQIDGQWKCLRGT